MLAATEELLIDQPLTVDEFLDIYQHFERKFELVDGRPVAMSGGTILHSRIAGNVFGALFAKLRGTGCRPLNSDAGLKVNDSTLRYPDVAVYCDRRDFDRNEAEAREYRHPSVVFEVLSPSTMKIDHAVKVVEYKGVESVNTIVLVDPVTQRLEIHERRAPGEWLHRLLPLGSELALKNLAITLTHADIFVD